jgi:hypothetical protein
MRSRSWKLARFVAPLGLIPLFACLSPPVESPRTTVTQETSVRVEQNLKNKVDLLFLIDNSPSMAPKQRELSMRFPQLIKKLDDFAAKGNKAWYHIGVVNSDLGSGPFTLNNGQCHPGGDGGKLQITAKSSSIGPPPANCANLTLSGGNFVDYNQLAGTNNIGGGLSVPEAFSCLSSVGDGGCGFEHQLEAVYRALHDNIAENAGFLRSDAILAVVFVTDEDDCSAPANGDLFDPSTAGVNMYGTLHSFRCTQWGIQCNGMQVPPMSTPTSFTGCSSQTMANGGKLIDLDKYTAFFTKAAGQGGVKVNPDDVIVVGITAPADPVGVSITTPCADQVNTPSCPILNHSCIATTNSAFFGDPAVRVNAVVSSAKHKNLTSICDTDYTAAIDALGDLIISQLGAGCLNAPVANRADGAPDCVVEDVTANPDGTTTIKEIPWCGSNGNAPTCWELVDKLQQYKDQMCVPAGQTPPATCMLPPTCQPVVNPVTNMQQLVTVSINRGSNMVPPNTTARVSCATIASSSK